MSSTSPGRVERLNESHNVASFTCCEPALAEFLANRALQCQLDHVCSVYLLISNRDNEIWGFFSLSNTAVYRDTFSKTQARKYKYNPIPAVLIGQMARDAYHSPKGFGQIILSEAIKEALNRHEWQLICVDPSSDESRAWFIKHGFQEVAQNYPPPSSNGPTRRLQLYRRRVDLDASRLVARQLR